MESDSTTMTSSSTTTTVESLRKALEELGLDTRGHKPELKKRLRKAKKKLAKEQVDTKKNDTSPLSSRSTTIKSVIIPDQSDQDQNEQISSKIQKQPFDYYLFFDVEATCEEGGGFEYDNEIIEFPIVLVNGRTFEIVMYLI
ncbi:hypothetical protein BDA99DRAFT_152791 [Phascolomyces articulosus]|uniref:SAP domain-containing protein n=1 Tax=Phascolomyces articulosus TaxID=60185 RepID=A0AAD5K445_9FUNG|nr:hypothetical protein BDA99DRAFT_152791 [Phascolomyces articulosus]